MTLIEFGKKFEKALVDNSPTILTTIGVVGSLTTAYLTGKATVKAIEILDAHPEDLDGRQKIEAVWKEYIPPAAMAIVSTTAIIGANRIGNRRAAAVAAAYSLTDRAFSEYKEKIVKTIGDKKEQAVRDEIAQDRISNNPPPKDVLVYGSNEVLCYETYTGRYFNSTVEFIKKAMNDTNYSINNSFYATLSDFYDKLGLPRTDCSDDVGWNTDRLLDISFSTCLSEDQRPCIAISFNVEPIRGYARVH